MHESLFKNVLDDIIKWSQLKIYLLLFYIQKYLQFFVPYKLQVDIIQLQNACGTPNIKIEIVYYIYSVSIN